MKCFTFHFFSVKPNSKHRCPWFFLLFFRSSQPSLSRVLPSGHSTNAQSFIKSLLPLYICLIHLSLWHHLLVISRSFHLTHIARLYLIFKSSNLKKSGCNFPSNSFQLSCLPSELVSTAQDDLTAQISPGMSLPWSCLWLRIWQKGQVWTSAPLQQPPHQLCSHGTYISTHLQGKAYRGSKTVLSWTPESVANMQVPVTSAPAGLHWETLSCASCDLELGAQISVLILWFLCCVYKVHSSTFSVYNQNLGNKSLFWSTF